MNDDTIQNLISELQDAKRRLWDAAHTVPAGTTLSAGTEVMEAESLTSYLGNPEQVRIYTLNSDFLVTHALVPFIRSLRDLPDPEDTGPLEFHQDEDDIVLEGVHCGYSHILSTTQARNLARMITEAIDGH